MIGRTGPGIGPGVCSAERAMRNSVPAQTPGAPVSARGGPRRPAATTESGRQRMPDRFPPPEPRSRPWIWAVYVVLFAASVPWYLPAGSPARLWLGLPHWVVISLAAYLAVAVFTAWVVARYWPVPAGPAQEGTAPGDAAQDSAAAGEAGQHGAVPQGSAPIPSKEAR